VTPSRDDLENKAYFVAEEHRSGPLEKLTWQELIEVLRSRCPGFSDTEYSDALNTGFTDSR
jgi:hypothetical protein